MHHIVRSPFTILFIPHNAMLLPPFPGNVSSASVLSTQYPRTTNLVIPVHCALVTLYFSSFSWNYHISNIIITSPLSISSSTVCSVNSEHEATECWDKWYDIWVSSKLLLCNNFWCNLSAHWRLSLNNHWDVKWFQFLHFSMQQPSSLLRWLLNYGCIAAESRVSVFVWYYKLHNSRVH